jgi:hypothetical protein
MSLTNLLRSFVHKVKADLSVMREKLGNVSMKQKLWRFHFLSFHYIENLKVTIGVLGTQIDFDLRSSYHSSTMLSRNKRVELHTKCLLPLFDFNLKRNCSTKFSNTTHNHHSLMELSPS